MDLLIVLDPLTALLLHLLHNVVTFILKQLVFLVFWLPMCICIYVIVPRMAVIFGIGATMGHL